MADDNNDEADADGEPARSTAPQSEYTLKQVAVGAVIALLGLLVTFGIPLAILL